MSNRFQELLAASRVILREGAVIERLRRTAGIQLDGQEVNSALIYQQTGGAPWRPSTRRYLEIGRRYELPLLLSTPPWRSGRDRIALGVLAVFSTPRAQSKTHGPCDVAHSGLD